MRKMMPVAQRVLGDSHQDVLTMRYSYAEALYKDAGATLDDVREAVTTLEETARTAQRVFGGAHPLTTEFFEPGLQNARAVLAAHEAGGESVVFVESN